MTLIKVLDGPTAQYLPGTGVMLVARSSEYFMELLSKPVRDAQEWAEVTAFVHECVHHFQVLSSAYLWRDAVARIDGSKHILFPIDGEDRAAHARDMARRQRAFRYRAFGVSCADLCESAAVLESYKATAAEPNVKKFLGWRDGAFPGKGNSVYRRSFDIMADVCGEEAAFDLLPVITLLALQGDIPGRSFDFLLSNESLLDGSLIGASADDVIAATGFKTPSLFDPQMREYLHRSQRHPTLYPVLIQTFHELGNEALDTFARPHRAFRSSLRESLLPAMVIGSHLQGGRVAMSFGAASESKELRMNLRVYSGILAAATQLVDPGEPWVPCQHAECPNHATKLCAGWFVPPPSPELCGFRSAVHDVDGNELYQVADEYAELGLSGAIAAIAGSTELTAIFPEAPSIPDSAEEESHAAYFDEHYQLDAEDNDGLVFLTCGQCKQGWQEWASHRKAERGFSAVCPACGEPMDVGPDSMMTLHM